MSMGRRNRIFKCLFFSRTNHIKERVCWDLYTQVNEGIMIQMKGS